MPDHINVEHLVGGPRERRRLLAHAAAAARAMGLARTALAGLPPAAAGTSATGPLQRAGDYLDNLGVPLWHDGTASLPQTLYFRGTWAAVALLIGFGSISAAVFIGDDVTLAHIVIPALLCAVGVGLRDLPDRPADRRGAARRRALAHSRRHRLRRPQRSSPSAPWCSTARCRRLWKCGPSTRATWP